MKLNLSIVNIVNIVLCLFVIAGLIYCNIKSKDDEYFFYDQTRKKLEKERKKKVTALKRKETQLKNMLKNMLKNKRKNPLLKELNDDEIKLINLIIKLLYEKNFEELTKIIKQNPMFLNKQNVKFYIQGRKDYNDNVKSLMTELNDYYMTTLTEEEKEELKRMLKPIQLPKEATDEKQSLPGLPEETEEERQFLNELIEETEEKQEFINTIVEEIVSNPNIDTSSEIKEVIVNASNIISKNINKDSNGSIPLEILQEKIAEKIEKQVEKKIEKEIQKEEMKEITEKKVGKKLIEKKSKSHYLLYSIIAIIIILVLYFIFKK